MLFLTRNPRLLRQNLKRNFIWAGAVRKIPALHWHLCHCELMARLSLLQEESPTSQFEAQTVLAELQSATAVFFLRVTGSLLV